MAINFPSTPSGGATHFEEGRAFIYDATQGKWRASRFMPVEAAASAPAGQEGKLWFDTNDGTLCIYYGSAWVEVSSFTIPSDVLTAGDIGSVVQAYNANILRASDLGEAVGVLPVSGTVQALTSGTTKDFTGLPAGLRHIELAIEGMSSNGAALKYIRIGSSAGLVTSGYAGLRSIFGANAGVANATSALEIASGAAADVTHGVVTLDLMDETTNLWFMQCVMGNSNNTNAFYSFSYVALPGVLDRVQLATANGVDTFDAGKVNIRYY